MPSAFGKPQSFWLALVYQQATSGFSLVDFYTPPHFPRRKKWKGEKSKTYPPPHGWRGGYPRPDWPLGGRWNGKSGLKVNKRKGATGLGMDNSPTTTPGTGGRLDLKKLRSRFCRVELQVGGHS